MERRKFAREYKREAVTLITERGVSIAQASRELGVHGSAMRRWNGSLVYGLPRSE